MFISAASVYAAFLQDGKDLSYFCDTLFKNSSTKGRLRTRAVHLAPLSVKGASKSAANTASKELRTRVSSKSKTSVILGSDGSLGANKASALLKARGPRLGPGDPCPEVESLGFVFELKKPIL